MIKFDLLLLDGSTKEINIDKSDIENITLDKFKKIISTGLGISNFSLILNGEVFINNDNLFKDFIKSNNKVNKNQLQLLSSGDEDFDKQLLDQSKIPDDLSLDTVISLIEKGANVDFNDEDGNSCIYYASMNGSLEVVKQLIQAGVSVDKPNNYGSTALHRACEFEYIEIVKYLVNNNADIDPKNKMGATPLAYANAIGNICIIEYLESQVRAASALTFSANMKKDISEKNTNGGKDQELS